MIINDTFITANIVCNFIDKIFLGLAMRNKCFINHIVILC